MIASVYNGKGTVLIISQIKIKGIQTMCLYNWTEMAELKGSFQQLVQE